MDELAKIKKKKIRRKKILHYTKSILILIPIYITPIFLIKLLEFDLFINISIYYGYTLIIKKQ